jgi:DNA repair exonuclease SbcCD nuclease subunit
LFVFCADLHLEDGAWSSRPGIYGDTYYSFEQIVDYCIQHKLPLIMGGDILEKKQNLARPVAKLSRGLTRLQNANVNAYYIQGNHEFDRHAPWLSVHPCQFTCTTPVQFDDVAVYGLDWLPKGEFGSA